MNETDLTALMQRATADEPPMPAGPAEDIARGRRLLRRRRTLIGAAAVTAAVTVGGGVGAMADRGIFGGPGSVQPAIQPPTRASMSPPPEPHVDGYPFLSTRAVIFDVTSSNLDPDRHHLEQLKNVSFDSGGLVVGTTMGWQSDTEQGMIQVEISEDPGQRRPAGECLGGPCEPYPLPDNRVARVGGATDGSGPFWASFDQSNEVTISVIVSPLASGISTLAAETMGTVTLEKVLDLVQDEGLHITEWDHHANEGIGESGEYPSDG
ncbi:MAG: hypothetical protein ACRDWI_19240 [Jiangellaceae bacterium]